MTITSLSELKADLHAALAWVSSRQTALLEELAALDRVSSVFHQVLAIQNQLVGRVDQPGAGHDGCQLQRQAEDDQSASSPEIPNPYADVDFSSCSNDRERILRIAQAADGTVLLKDATDAIYALGTARGKKASLRSNLARILVDVGERIEAGVYRVNH